MTEAQLTAQKFDDGTIIAASPIREEKGSEPARIFIREFENQYVVHMQIFAKPHPTNCTTYYIWGTYIPKTDDQAFTDAWYFFDKRSRELHFLPTRSDRRKPVSV